MDDRDFRIKEELQRLHAEVANCAHCEALRGQMARLSVLLPPAPVRRSDGLWYVFNPPPEYEALIQQRYEYLMGSKRPEDKGDA